MIILQCPFLWRGHLIPAGKYVSLPAELEKKLLHSGNATRTELSSPTEQDSDKVEAAPAEQSEKKSTGKGDRVQQASVPPAELELGR